MNPDIFLGIGFAILIALLGFMVVIGTSRGKRIQHTNEQIEANQRRQLEMAERQTIAIERIAKALEKQ